jgi:hemolysin activation/secretion protein
MTLERIGLVIFAALLCASPCHSSTGPETPKLAAVVVSGSTAYTAPQLFGTYQAQLGDPVTRECARSIIAAIAELYARDGYVRPELGVDDALLASGVLRVNVHEARVTKVVFDGAGTAHGHALQDIATRLTAAVPLRSDDIPDALRAMRALPGLTIEASTRRDAVARNGHELHVRTSFSNIDGLMRVNNRGTDEVGPAFLLGQVHLNGVAGSPARLGVIFAAAADPGEYVGAGVSGDLPFGTSGTRASLLLFHSRSAPTESPTNIDARYTRDRATLRVTRPVHASSSATLNLGGGIEAEDLAIRLSGTKIRDDRLRVLEVSLRGSLRGAGAMQYSSSLLVRQGLAGLGAGLHAADLAADPRRADFRVAQLQAVALRRFATHWTARVDAFAQYSGHVLPDSERFKIGGDRLGRGFEVAEIAGDRGLGGKLELRRDLLDAGRRFGRVSSYGFYDVGTAWKKGNPGSESATTAGLGFGMAGAALSGYIELATPLDGPDIEGRRAASLFAELGWRF